MNSIVTINYQPAPPPPPPAIASVTITVSPAVACALAHLVVGHISWVRSDDPDGFRSLHDQLRQVPGPEVPRGYGG